MKPIKSLARGACIPARGRSGLRWLLSHNKAGFPPPGCEGFMLGCWIPDPICSKTEWQHWVLVLSDLLFPDRGRGLEASHPQPAAPDLLKMPADPVSSERLKATQQSSDQQRPPLVAGWWQTPACSGGPVGSAPCHLLPASVATREIPPCEEVEPVPR